MFTFSKLILMLLQLANRAWDYAEKKGIIDEATRTEIYNTADRLNDRLNKAEKARADSIADSKSGGLHRSDGYKTD